MTTRLEQRSRSHVRAANPNDHKRVDIRCKLIGDSQELPDLAGFRINLVVEKQTIREIDKARIQGLSIRFRGPSRSQELEVSQRCRTRRFNLPGNGAQLSGC
jgi:hypothetical protein